MPFNTFQPEHQGGLQAVVLRGIEESKKKSGGFLYCGGKKRRGGELEHGLLLSSEPRSVLDRRRSASPRTSTSTLSSSIGGGDITSVAADKCLSASEEAKKEEWTEELPPIPAGLAGGGRVGVGVEDWESVLSSSVGVAGNVQDQSFLGWVMGGCGGGEEELKNHQDLSFGIEGDFVNPGGLSSISIGVANDVEVSVSVAQQQMQSQINPSFLLSLPQFAVHDEIQPISMPQTHPIPLFSEFHTSFQHQPPFVQLNAHHSKPVKSKVAPVEENTAMSVVVQQQQQQQHHLFVDQLFHAAELVEAGNCVSALAILTRLNHQFPSPVGKPVLRTAFYFKEALQILATSGARAMPLPETMVATPVDVVIKLGAYKAFSDVSPIVQFTNFTCIQAMLEELGSAERIHIIDFDIGIGGHWPSFMQEFAARRNSVTMTVPLLKITAFVSPYSHHHIELQLTRENLCEFARGLNIPFEFNVLILEPTNPSLLLGLLPGANEAIAVNLPVGSASYTRFPNLLRLVKQLSPKVLVSIEYGSDHSDLPFSHHFLNAFQSCNVLLDSIDAAVPNQDATSKIERFFVQPRIESLVLGHHLSVDKVLPWRSLFANAGFVPLQLSNFTETQAECILKRVQVRGFHVEKRQTSLYLCWQRGDLVSVSAWKC